MRFRLTVILKFISLVLVFVCVYPVLRHYQKEGAKRALRDYRAQRYYAAQLRTPRDGPGERGEGVVLTKEEQDIADKLFYKASFNVFASDKMAMDRSIPDTRMTEWVVLLSDYK